MEKDNSGKPKPTILTCAQPTGVLTLGNYLGAVRNWSEMLDNHDCYFGIVDLHAITTPSSLPFFAKMCSNVWLNTSHADWIPRNVINLYNPMSWDILNWPGYLPASPPLVNFNE